MALFGFNKQKVLASAEKYVQQGKLQSAISEYEKILKNDAKDLTVTNTVGDLYSRIGESDKATQCFRTVGDAYASQGFTVKAIAMYKKICKLQPSLESLLKLAELYTQQGLFNDARAQYLQVAEEFLKAGELENAVRIFQKILEMDPENGSMRVKLAEVYIRLGKKQEAWQIFTAAAESLRSKGSLGAADEVLQRMLTLDPTNSYALLMQGKNQLESGDAAGAVTSLAKISDIDSKPEGLRDLLKAYLQTGQLSDAGSVANKLLTVHNDLGAIATFADALMQAGQYENALQVYDQHAERLLAENSDKVIENLRTIIGHVRENPDSLQKLLELFKKAGDNSHVSEVMELLAHASVQSGDLGLAKDLYQKLANVEPQNTLHMQNYQQVVSQLGGTSGAKLITPEEAVVLLDDLEATAPAIHQHYSDEVSMAIRSALTDAELFISYNMPAKALGPLVGALPMAPSDLRLNQRLAALHTRAGRFAEAAICCRTLQNIYSEADNPEEATRYGELAERYEERSSAPGRVSDEEEQHVFLDAPAPKAQAAAAGAAEAAVPQFAIEDGPAEFAMEEPASTGHESIETAAPWPTAAAEEEITVEPVAESGSVDETPAAEPEAASAEAEIDLSSEWDDAITVEGDEPAVEEAQAEVANAVGAHDVPAADPTDEVIEEIRFYLGHGMPEQAMAALARLQTLTSDHAKLAEIRAEVEAATAVPAVEEVNEAVDVVEEAPAAEGPEMEVEVEETPTAAVEEEPAVAELVTEAKPEPTSRPSRTKHEKSAAPPVVETPEPMAEPEAAPAHGVLKEFVSDLESSLGETFLPGAVAKPAPVEKPLPPAVPQTPAAAATKAPALGKFVADIEASLGEDFLKAAPKPEVAAAKAHPAPVAPPMAASAAASAAPTAAAPVPVVPAASAPAVRAASVPTAAWPTQPAAAPKPAAPIVPPSRPPAPAAAKPSSPFGDDAGVDLAEMFGELKQDLEADVASADEDPETHYNLGIAFREMGLLDEAIGELQKACQSFDRGHPFPQIMQTYTWLAQCFLEKGVPEAAVRWYAKALAMQNIDGETRVALNYELAAAYETAGDRNSALKHFMDVYGSNIDYRDVAERIKALKA